IRLRLNREATRSVVLRDMNWLLRQGRLNPNAMLFFYYSGHGIFWKTAPDAPAEAFLLPVNFNPKKAEPREMIPLAWFREALDALPNPEIVVVLDACFTNKGRCDLGSWGGSYAPNPAFFSQAKKSWAVAGIKKETQVYSPGRQNAFSFFFSRALLGSGDGMAGRPIDDWIDFQETGYFVHSAFDKMKVDVDPLFTNPVEIRLTKIGGAR
ncbi:caspase family protein, partial [Magnetococcales bacterium HHB-1]